MTASRGPRRPARRRRRHSGGHRPVRGGRRHVGRRHVAAHPGADRVIVVRREDEPPRRWDDGTAVEASPDTFTEAGLRTGTEYYYRITTCYRTPDGLAASRPASSHGRSPDPRRRGHGPARHRTGRRRRGVGGHLDATTLRPGSAGPRRRAAALAPRHPHLAGRHGRAAGCSRRTAPRPDGRDVHELRLPPDVITSWPDRRTPRVGGRQHGEVRMVESVRGLTADRMHDQVRFGSIWPMAPPTP